MMRRRVLALLAVGVLASHACESKMVALGDYTSIIVTASPDLWAEAERPVTEALERTTFTVREEKTFTVTHRDPSDSAAWELRLLKQQLVIGTPDDPWVQAALSRKQLGSLPRVVLESNVWARQQAVTVVVLDEPRAESLTGLLPDLAAHFDESYRKWVAQRMFASGANTELASSLMEDAGFSLLLPKVYEHTVRDSVHVFRNDNPDPSELIRQIAVTWWDHVPKETLRGEDLLDWRAEIVEDYYSYPQVVKGGALDGGPDEFHGRPSYRVQGVWENPPGDDFPAGGPFVLRAIACFGPQMVSNRLYLVDAWLYAPGKEKYAYMIQLENILDSFSCAQSP